MSDLRSLPAALSMVLARLEHELHEANPATAPLVIGELERIKTTLLLHCLTPERVASKEPESPNLSGDEAARYLKMRRSHLDHLRRKGEVEAMLSGKQYVYRREHLDALQKKLSAQRPRQDDGLQSSQDNGTVSSWHESQKGTSP